MAGVDERNQKSGLDDLEHKASGFGSFIERHLRLILWLVLFGMIIAFAIGAVISFLLLPNKF